MNEALQQAGNNKLQLWFVNYTSYVLSTTEKCTVTYQFIFQQHIAAASDGTITSRTRRYSVFAVKEKNF